MAKAESKDKLLEIPQEKIVDFYEQLIKAEKRVIEKYGVEPKNVANEMKNTDKKRAKFHNFYSEEEWGEATTYDLAINVAKLGIDGTVDLISEYIKAQG